MDAQSRAPPAWCYSLDVASCARYFSIVSFETRACEVRDGRCVAGAVCRTNCNGTVVDDEKMGQVIQLQGDKREEFKKFIVENELAEANTIKVHGHG